MNLIKKEVAVDQTIFHNESEEVISRAFIDQNDDIFLYRIVKGKYERQIEISKINKKINEVINYLESNPNFSIQLAGYTHADILRRSKESLNLLENIETCLRK